MLTFIILLFVGGLIVGALARLALPGPDPMSIPMTALLGIGGSLIGGILARVLFGRPAGFLFALIGAIVLLYLYRRFAQGRGLTGPAARAPRRPL
jgi:uncharacterized membrane protein YeaQ/YmgE (transglycosylase-associated protein family)